MAGYYAKNFTTVVMDGSNRVDLGVIITTIDRLTKKRHGKAACRPLDRSHPTMIVIDVITTQNIYDQIQESLSEFYPGLCMFNPPILMN